MTGKSFEEWMATAIRYGLTTVLLFLICSGFFGGVAIALFMNL